MKIGITYNLKSEAADLSPPRPRVDDMYEEFDSPETIDAICSALQEMGHQCVKLGFGERAIGKLLSDRVDFVFNIAEGFYGRSREAHIPALLEMLEIPFTGPGPLTAALTLDKILAKRMAAQSGINTPAHCEIESDAKADIMGLKFPLIVKPAHEGSSVGIRKDSKVRDKDELKKKIDWLVANYPRQPIVAEEFIGGREFTVGVVGNSDPEVLGIMEIVPVDTDLREFIYSLEVKRNYLEKVEYRCPPEIDSKLQAAIEDAALLLYRLFGCRDISRFDFRIDGKGNPYFLEVNTLPGLHPVSSDIVIMARLLGIEYNRLIKRIFNCAQERYN